MIRLARVFCMFSALVVQIVRTTQGPIDLVFVLDGSLDIGDFNFKLSIQAASGYLEDANIGPNRTRVGVVVYSTEVGDYVPLMSDIPVLKSSIMNFKYPAMTRATDVGIRKAVDILTKEKRNVSRVMVIVLSGKSDNRTKTKLESELAQAKGIDIWGLGVFPYLSMTEFVNLTTNGAKQAFEIENIRDFFGAFSNLPAGEINSIYTYREPVDLVFAIDVSFEIGEENFKLIQSNVLKCLGLLFIGPLDTHVGVVLSTSVSSPSIQLQSDYETIYSSVSSIKLSDRVVTTDKVLGTAVNSLLATQRKLFKAVILITDGHYINKYRNETHDEAIRAKDNNITLWGVSIDCTFPLTEDLCRISEAFYLKDLTSNIQTLEYSDTVTTNACHNGVPTCAPSCSNSCHPNACDIFTGTCNTGCPDGYLPPNCTLPLNTTETNVPTGGWVGVGIASCVVLLLIVIAIVFLYRRKRIKHNEPARKSKVPKEPDNDPYDDPDESDHYDTIEPPKPYEREYAKSPSEQGKEIPDKQYDHLSEETVLKNDYAKVQIHDNAKELEDDQSSKKSYTEQEAESELNQYSYSGQSKNEKLGRLSDYIDVI